MSPETDCNVSCECCSAGRVGNLEEEDGKAYTQTSSHIYMGDAAGTLFQFILQTKFLKTSQLKALFWDWSISMTVEGEQSLGLK